MLFYTVIKSISDSYSNSKCMYMKTLLRVQPWFVSAEWFRPLVRFVKYNIILIHMSINDVNEDTIG